MYDYCAVQSGDGTYARIKQAMAEGVDKGRVYMFDDASRRLLQELEQIQVGENLLCGWKISQELKECICM